MSQSNFKLAVLCGGPSRERGISLNSARSVCDHLSSDQVEVIPVYFDLGGKIFALSSHQIRSNTPSDFDFKLAQLAKPLSRAGMIKLLCSVDLTYPAIHGPFGEDGALQSILEKADVPFVGSPSAACALAFDKFRAGQFLTENGFTSIPRMVVERGDRGVERGIRAFFKSVRGGRYIVKPAQGGSSLGVASVASPSEALAALRHIFSEKVYKRAVIEPFCRGREFTVIVVQNSHGDPVALLPTEVAMDYEGGEIFDYRRKYLATQQVSYHCPPRFSDAIVRKIQSQAATLFRRFGMRDVARLDGWLLDGGEVFFSDFNIASGMEQNSFLFIQGARVGLSHRDLLRHIVSTAAARIGRRFPIERSVSTRGRKQVNVVFGGSTAERQVSLMSGTNVWLKLRRSKRYNPVPWFLDSNGGVWQIPYAFALNHTVEDVLQLCRSAAKEMRRIARLRGEVLAKLGLKATEEQLVAKRITLKKFLTGSPAVFLGLHGGIGENGELQKILEHAHVPFNGSGSVASRICMDKVETSRRLQGLEGKGVLTLSQFVYPLEKCRGLKAKEHELLWEKVRTKVGARFDLIAKPRGDGCSAGIARLTCARDLHCYIESALSKRAFIPDGTLKKQHGIIEMPSEPMESILFEPFIETDHVEVRGEKLVWKKRTGWVEVTVGVLERRGKLHAFNPSITVAQRGILSLEEKFQGGTGVNITPPPRSHVPKLAVQRCRRAIELVAKQLGIQGYARIDCFLECASGRTLVIEANSLPGLTAATVLYHQALAESPALPPTALLEAIMDHALTRYT